MGNGTSIGRVRGLGSAQAGAHHWLLQRITAIGNVVLTVWFVASLLWLPNLHYLTVRDWLAHLMPATGMALLIVCSFWHARLGVQVLIEDYISHHGNRFACIVLLNLAVFGGAGLGLFIILRLALGAA